MVAAVFKISQPNTPNRILKVCSRKRDFLREAYFLNYFSGKIPVLKIVQPLEPEEGLDARCVDGMPRSNLLKSKAITKDLAKELGSLLALIHFEPASGYGDLTDPFRLSNSGFR